MRVACYARYSSDLQRETSLDDQLRVCREFAEGQGWDVLPDHVYKDAALTGASTERPGLQALLTAATQRPRPFDVLLADDSSRVSRDLPDALRTLQILKFHGVRVIYVAQQIDSANEQAETLVAVRGLVDGLYLRDLRAKIQRGLAGQLERGFATGSVTFGYRTVPVPDPSGARDLNGNPVLIGKRVEVVPAEAATIARIFELYADGAGVYRICARLNEEGVKGPRGARWKAGTLGRVLQNERYLGRLIWGRTTFERRPGTRQMVARAVPRDQWRVQERPELRIVSDELWARVEARRNLVRRTALQPGQQLMRGRNAMLFSNRLLSGFLRCGVCGRAMTVVSRGHGSPRYGCPVSWRNGVTECSNRLTIRAKVADPLLLERLQAELLAPATVQAVVARLEGAINERFEAQPRLLHEAQQARADAVQRLERLFDAIERGVAPTDLSSRITALKDEIARLDREVAELSDRQPQRLAIVPAWVEQRLAAAVSTLQVSTERTKSAFLKMGLTATMVPMTSPGARPFYRATVESDLPEMAGSAELSPPKPRSATDRSGPARIPGAIIENLAEIRARSLVDRLGPR